MGFPSGAEGQGAALGLGGVRDQGSCSIMMVNVDRVSAEIKCLPQLHGTA